MLVIHLKFIQITGRTKFKLLLIEISKDVRVVEYKLSEFI